MDVFFDPFTVPHSKVIIILLYAVGTLLLAAIVRSILLLQTTQEAFDRLYSSSLVFTTVSYKKSTSILRVEAMLKDAEACFHMQKSVDIYEAHLEPKPPINNNILSTHQQFVAKAMSRNWPLNWNIIVGNEAGQKDVWLQRLWEEMVVKNNIEDTRQLYSIFEYTNKLQSFNFVIIPVIHQTFLGLGNWLGEDNTGGILIVNEHFTEAMKQYWNILRSQTHVCKEYTGPEQ